MSFFNKIFRLYSIRQQVTNYNMKQLTRLKTFVIRVNFENDDVEVKNAKEDNADELFKMIFFNYKCENNVDTQYIYIRESCQ